VFAETSLVDQDVDQGNPRLREAKGRFLKEVSRFEELYDLYLQKHPAVSSIDMAAVKQAFKEASLNDDNSQSADTFGILLSDVLRRRELSEGVGASNAVKVGKVLTKMYPLIKISLGIAQTAADVIPVRPHTLIVRLLAFSP
jgi:hypothetical protein